jgi:hypothetical protein
MKHFLLLIYLVSLFITGVSAEAQTGVANESQFAIPATDDGLPGAGPIRRYDWFKNLWAQRRATWAGQVERDQGAVVFLGDSITQGWGDHLQNVC